MANWYASREAVKRAVSINGSDQDAKIDRLIEAASRDFDRDTRRFFIPRTETRLYRWPQVPYGTSYILWLDGDLLSVTTLQTKAQDASPTTIAATDFFLEPTNLGPPYNRIEIDLSSAAALESGDTPQRSISVLGSWGYCQDTASAGTVTSGLAADAAATTFVCSDGSLIDVGDTLLIQTEQLFVSERATVDVGKNTNGALNADKSQTTVTLEASHGVNAGEVILVNSEKMYVDSVTGNDLTVIRAYDGTTLAAHSDAQDVYAYRTLTVERGANGTTAAVHANATAVSKYVPPLDVSAQVQADAIAAHAQEQAAWGRTVGTGEGAREFSSSDLARRRQRIVATYQRARSSAI